MVAAGVTAELPGLPLAALAPIRCHSIAKGAMLFVAADAMAELLCFGRFMITMVLVLKFPSPGTIVVDTTM